MDIPDFDELQWLESNSHHQDEYYPLAFDLELEQQQQQPQEQEGTANQVHEDEQPHIPPIRTDNLKKRNRSHLELDESSFGSDLDDVAPVRARTDETPVTLQDNDDDYSMRLPSPQCDSVVECLSRFASDIDGDCLPVTVPYGSGNSDRVYAKLDEHVFRDVRVEKSRTVVDCSGLISEPIGVLLQKAEQDAMLKALQASSEVQNNLQLPDTSLVTEELWVNKYAPKSFTELLSDEHTNREVLFWLKQWDSSVFGTDIRNTGDEVLSALRRHSALPHHPKKSDMSHLSKSWGSRSTVKYVGNSAMLEQENTIAKGIQGLQNKKPKGSGTLDHKVLLLCGPPGLGKTTLAHVAARHCGYHVVEINASDDRSSATIEAKILDAVQMNSVMPGSKPKCLVIDEIDGALGEGKGAVEVILKMVAAERKSYAGKETFNMEELSRKKSSKTGSKSVSLSRPVICICNDLYAPSLRPLRLVAKVHMFAQPSVSRVVSRLKYICNKEGLKPNSIALTALAEYTECDIRSCLNTLQFLHKKKESLNLVALNSQVIGRKDMTRSVFDIWKEIFQKRKTKQSPKCDASLANSFDARDSMFSLISNRGDYELIFDGIHENFLQLHYHDPMVHKTVHCLDALGVSDLLNQCVMRSHNMFLYVYQTPITLTMHRLLAHVGRPSIEWPKSFQRHRTLRMEKMEAFRSWQTKVSPSLLRHLSLSSFVEDTVSLLLHILSPADLRPVALHLLAEKENNDLAHLIRTMVAYSLTYKHAKADPSTNSSRYDEHMDAPSLSFDPPIQDFVRFKDYKPGHIELKSTMKQVILHEVEKQKIVQESMSRSVHSVEKSQRENNTSGNKENGMLGSSKFHGAAYIDKNVERMEKVTSASSGGSADLVKAKSAGSVKKPAAGSFNLLDRFKKVSRKGDHNVDSPAEKPAIVDTNVHALLFKFNEGFTNAVKRPLRIREFLL